MSENDKSVPLIVCNFHTKCGKMNTLSFFQKRRFQGFISEILRVAGLLGEHFIFFFKSLGTTKISKSLKLSENINVVLLINFSNIREVIKFYNLVDKTFETDLGCVDDEYHFVIICPAYENLLETLSFASYF